MHGAVASAVCVSNDKSVRLTRMLALGTVCGCVCDQLLQLFWILLFTAGSVDLILLQNPPTYGASLVLLSFLQ